MNTLTTAYKSDCLRASQSKQGGNLYFEACIDMAPIRTFQCRTSILLGVCRVLKL